MICDMAQNAHDKKLRKMVCNVLLREERWPSTVVGKQDFRVWYFASLKKNYQEKNEEAEDKLSGFTTLSISQVVNRSG